MQLRVVAVGESASTLRGRFVHLLDPAVPARVTWLAPAEVSGDAVVLTDDLRAAELRDLLLRITSPAGVYGRGLVLSWDAPRHSAALFGVPFHRLLSLPEQRGEVLPWLRQLAGPSAWPLKVGPLAEGVPGALALAVRVVLNRAADTAAPPPRSIAQLSRAVGCNRSHLHVAASACGFDLLRCLRLARLRWMALRAREVEPEEMAAAVGYRHRRDFRRHLRRTHDLDESEISKLDLAEIDTAIRRLMDPLVSPPDRARGSRASAAR